MVMSRIWFTAAQKAELWERWKNGQKCCGEFANQIWAGSWPLISWPTPISMRVSQVQAKTSSFLVTKDTYGDRFAQCQPDAFV
jgi:hypothetical protein